MSGLMPLRSRACRSRSRLKMNGSVSNFSRRPVGAVPRAVRATKPRPCSAHRKRRTPFRQIRSRHVFDRHAVELDTPARCDRAMSVRASPASRRRVLRRAGFFKSNAVASEKSRERAAASRNSPFVQRQDDLIQCQVWSVTVERKDLLGVLLQWRSASAARRRFASRVLAKALHPPDGGTDTYVKRFRRFTA